MSAFCVYLRVRYAECDAQQVVFNARYGDYVDLVVTEYFRHLMGGFQALIARGMDTQVVRLLTEWKSSAKFDDVLAISITTSKVGNTSFTLSLTMVDHPSGRLVTTNEAVYVMVDTKQYQKVAIPEDVRESLLRGAPDQVVNFSGAAL